MYSINQFKALAVPASMIITQHSRIRFAERGITIQDVCRTIQTGNIIEQYPNDFPFPSCLILGRSGGKLIHVCASIQNGMIYVITAYIPDPAKWEADLATRKEETK